MKRFNITVNGKAYDVQVEEVGGAAAPAAPAAVPAAPAAPAPAAAPAPKAEASAPAPAAAAPAEGAETINAPMPGNVLNVMVKAGDKVAKGDVLLVLEAMKMENEIMAPHDGTILGVHVTKGESVDSGKLLVSMQKRSCRGGQPAVWPSKEGRMNCGKSRDYRNRAAGRAPVADRNSDDDRRDAARA